MFSQLEPASNQKGILKLPTPTMKCWRCMCANKQIPANYL